MRPPLADSHVHLDRYRPADVAEMLDRARSAGVLHFLAVGVDAASSTDAAALAAREPGVRAAVGIHPTRLGPDWSLDALRALIDQPGVAAIGEVGLDDGARAAPLHRQRVFFAACLDLAVERDLPVVLHVVGHHARAQAMLVERQGVRAVVHYFQGDRGLADAYLELGCFISVGKPVTRPARAALREAVGAIPLDRLLLETDTYPLPGRTTEPRDVVEVGQAVAKLQGVGTDAVARATTANYLRLFGR